MRKIGIQEAISLALRVGVSASMAFVVAGVLLIFVTGKADGYSLSELSNLTAPYTSQLNSSVLDPSGILHGLSILDGAYYITLGLWILVFTPVTVLVISVLEFINGKNYRYVIMSVIVLTNMLVAMLLIR